MPIISIIVPFYNVERELARCLDSIINQSFKDFEVLLVNDGSTDNSFRIADAYSRKDTRIKVFNQKNKGVGPARNVGLENAIGEYIAFIDADDCVHHKFLETLYSLIYIFKASIAICGCQKLTNYTETESEIIDFKACKTEVIEKKKLFKLLFDKFPYLCVWGKLFKQDLIKDKRFSHFKMNEDLEFNSIVFNNATKVVLTNLPLYNYIIRKGSISHSSFNDNYISELEAKFYIYRNATKFDELTKSFILKRLYKNLISIRYQAPEVYKERIQNISRSIYKETHTSFLLNRHINPLFKISMLLFIEFPILYRGFRSLMALNASFR